jgi:hypothetical protein
MHPGGKPTLYRLEMYDRLVDAMANGLTAEATAARIGISARSLLYWQQQPPEFAGHTGRAPAMANGAPYLFSRASVFKRGRR